MKKERKKLKLNNKFTKRKNINKERNKIKRRRETGKRKTTKKKREKNAITKLKGASYRVNRVVSNFGHAVCPCDCGQLLLRLLLFLARHPAAAVAHVPHEDQPIVVARVQAVPAKVAYFILF